MKKYGVGLITVMFVLAVSGAAFYAEDGQMALNKAGEQENSVKDSVTVKKEEAMSVNLEFGLYDLVNKHMDTQDIFYKHVVLLACNFKLYEFEVLPSADLTIAFGPYFSQSHESNDLGLRGSGYFFPLSKKRLPLYAALSIGGCYSFISQNPIMYFAIKGGGQLPIDPVELFLEFGMKIQTDSSFTDLFINTGIRVYIF